MAVRSGLNVDPADRSALRSLAFRLTGATDRRVTLTEALRAACIVADAHIDEAVAALPGGDSIS